MHNAWMRTVAGRLKSDYSYSPSVYNNLQWPSENDHNVASIVNSAQQIINVRLTHTSASLAVLYNPVTMPVDLVDAHRALDKAVDKAYGYKGADDDASRVAFLFKLYEQATSLLPTTPAPVKRKRKAKGDDS